MLSQRWSRVRQEIMDLYQALDEAVQDFAAQSGIACPPGCGACCLSPQAEATIAEMLPLAERLFASDAVDETIARLREGGAVCVQYQADPQHPERGSCRNYAQRPVLCRLFGYSGSRDKAGQLRYGACRVLQKVEAERVAIVESRLKEGTLSIPLFAPAHERIGEIAGILGGDILPINQALLRAIEVVGLDVQLHTTAPSAEPSAAAVPPGSTPAAHLRSDTADCPSTPP